MARQLYVAQSIKGSTEIMDHTVNWAEVLNPLEDRIVDATFEVTGDMEIFNAQFTHLDTTLWLEKGTAGQKYTASHTIVTASGRRFRRSVRVLCVQR